MGGNGRHGVVVMAVAAAVTVVAAGCQSGGEGNTPAPTSAPPASSSPATLSECTNLIASGQAFAGTVARLIDGTGSREQVRTAATQLSNAMNNAQHTIGAAASARLNDAKAALQRVVAAANAQPPDVAAMRTGARDTLTALRDTAKLCKSSAPATPSPGG